MASRDQLREVAPEFASESNATLDSWLGRAARRLDAAVWDTLYVDACIYLAAHLLTLSKRASAGLAGAGPVVSQAAGDTSVSYGAVVGVMSPDALYGTTSYGIEFLNLKRLIVTTPFVVTR